MLLQTKRLQIGRVCNMAKEMKALDNQEFFNLVVFFRSQGYAIYNLDENSIVLRKIFPEGKFDEEKNNGLMVYINQKEKHMKHILRTRDKIMYNMFLFLEIVLSEIFGNN